MNAPVPTSQDDTPPPLRPSAQPFSKRAMIIASLVIGLPLLAFLVLRPQEDGPQGPSLPANEASAPVAEAQASASAEPSANAVPVAVMPAPLQANRVGVLVLNAQVAGLGFADVDQNFEGALSCDPDDSGYPITVWYLVGSFPERRLEAFDDHWAINGITVSHSLVLRVDGQAFYASDEQILTYDSGAVKVKGDLPFSPGLYAALQNADSIELISGDTVLSIAPGAMRSDMIEVANKCAQIAQTAQM